MLAPTWQFVVMVVIFSLGVIMNWAALGFVIFAKGAGEPIMSDGKYKSPAVWFFRTIVCGFMMYVSYSLFAWYTGPLGLIILVAHWASLIAGFIWSVSIQGVQREHSVLSVLWGSVYTTFMLGCLAVYGVNCL